MHAPPVSDERLRHVPPDRWERARLLLGRHWLREARVEGALVHGSFSGLVGVRARVDLATLSSRCECGQPQPCEHALALLLHLAPPPSPAQAVTGLVSVAVSTPVSTSAAPVPPAPAGPPKVEPSSPAPAAPVEAPPLADATAFRFGVDEADPGRLALVGHDGGRIPEPVAEALRWLWWKRDGPLRLRGEGRTLAQAAQLLVSRGVALAPPAATGPLAGVRATFHQRALGESIHVKLDAPGSDGALTLAARLSERRATPLPGALPADLWTLPDETGFASWLLGAQAEGADVRPDLQLNPKPLRGVEVHLDQGCLPARLREPGEPNPVLRDFLSRCLGAAPTMDEEHGHVLLPATRVVDVEEGLRALGADVTYRRLAPAHQRFLQWSEQAPEDFTGARPRLREPYHGTLEEEPPGLRERVTLAGYQREAVAFIRHHDHTCLLADDMGLGKTLEAIASAQFLPGRVLVVCPASAREVWRREVGKFTTATVAVLGPGADPALAQGPEKYLVTGYDNLAAFDLRPEAFDLVVLDESHYVKNAATGRARAVREKLSAIPRRLVISGTPVMNAPEEMRAQLAFLHPDEWSDAGWFRRRFVEPFEEGAPEVREAVLRRLRQFLEGVCIRREKATALPDLPPKSLLWHRVKLPPEARRAYVALEEEFQVLAASEGDGFLSSSKASGRLERLKQSALAGKMPEALAFLRQVLDAGEKVVVFSRYRNALSSLQDELAPHGPVVLHGETSPEERAEAERRFQEDPACRVFLGQLVAAGTALTLVAGTHAVFLDLSWNPADHRQAMDRIHRRGQTRPVTVHFFLAEETVDEDVAHVLDEKGRMMDALLAPTGGGGAELKGARRLVGERLLSRRGAAEARAA